MWTLIYEGVATHRRSVEAFGTPYRAARFIETDLVLNIREMQKG